VVPRFRTFTSTDRENQPPDEFTGTVTAADPAVLAARRLHRELPFIPEPLGGSRACCRERRTVRAHAAVSERRRPRRVE
jgi:hypothetical protein